MKNLLVILVFFITSCTTGALTQENIKILQQNKFLQKDYQTRDFKIFTLQKITAPAKPIRIYIEGDGHAYISRTEPSSNPTPKNPLVLELIEEDNYTNIIYIARPCQYLTDNNCEQKYWTTSRFSDEVINSINEVIKKFSNKKIELVGYSGGAEIAIFVAAQNPNVISIRTIAGNLDPKTFTEYHKVTVLELPKSQDSAIKITSKIPQIHFIGSNDKIVPAIIAEKYMEKQKNNSCTKLVKVDDTTHSDGWIENWKALLNMQPQCR